MTRRYQAAVIARGKAQQDPLGASNLRILLLITGVSRCRRSVICHYEAPATAEGVTEASIPDPAPVPPSATRLLPRQNTGEQLINNIHPSNRALFMLTDSLSPSLEIPTTADGNFHLRVCEIIRAYGKFVDDVTVTYFRGVHRWLPVISRSRFHDRLVLLQSSAAADFSILLLSMCLITHHPVRPCSGN